LQSFFFSLRSLQTVCALVIRLGTGGVAAAFVSGAADLASAILADMIRFCVADVPWLSTTDISDEWKVGQSWIGVSTGSV